VPPATRGIEEILIARSRPTVFQRAESPGEVSPPPACPVNAGSPKPPSNQLSIVEKIEDSGRLESAPMLQRDHGDVELADVQGKKIYVP
jgi:NifU-like protein